MKEVSPDDMNILCALARISNAHKGKDHIKTCNKLIKSLDDQSLIKIANAIRDKDYSDSHAKTMLEWAENLQAPHRNSRANLARQETLELIYYRDKYKDEFRKSQGWDTL